MILAYDIKLQVVSFTMTPAEAKEIVGDVRDAVRQRFRDMVEDVKQLNSDKKESIAKCAQ